MYYYYDLLLNFCDSEKPLYDFYEWDENDNIEFIKKIPLYKISIQSFKTILLNQVKFDKNLLEQIKSKTILKNSSNSIEYCLLVCDGKNALALELNKDGLVISRSKLLLNDELNLNEIMFTMKEYKLEFEKIKEYKRKNDIRQIAEIKDLISLEINNLYKEKKLSKLKYLYLEWFDYEENDIEIIYQNMINDLKGNFKEKHQTIYNLIKLSYDKVK